MAPVTFLPSRVVSKNICYHWNPAWAALYPKDIVQKKLFFTKLTVEILTTSGAMEQSVCVFGACES